MNKQYKIKNGILYENGKATFAFGTSYYPSFHASKYQVPETGDRIGEMEKDFREMRESGIKFVRCAALGNLKRTDEGSGNPATAENIAVETPFIDRMAEEAEKAGLGISIRLNGYFTNLSHNTGYEFLNNLGQAMDKYWTAFMQSSFYHEGARRDNYEATKALAAHFKDYPALISYQIYNEPHYPYNGVFDYHPATIAAYKKWLADKGLPEKEPPRERPAHHCGAIDKKDIQDWIHWREFSCMSLVGFLDETAHAAHDAVPGIDCYTCYIGSPACTSYVCDGYTYFDEAKDLSTLGLTMYFNSDGVDYFTFDYAVSLAESAAATYHKHAWCAELDARVHMPYRKFCQETLELIGTGYKGINYYEWRGDYPDKGSPLPDNCGMVHNDGSKTEKFDEAVRLLHYLDKYGERIALSEKHRTGVAMLHSDHAYRYYDSFFGKVKITDNISLYPLLALSTARELREAGFHADYVRAVDLEKNIFGVKYLFVPSLIALSDEEVTLLKAFEAKGGKVFYNDNTATFDSVAPQSWWELSDRPKFRVTVEFRGGASILDIVEKYNIQPMISTNHRHLFAGIIESIDDKSKKIVTLVNNDPYERPIPSHAIDLHFDAKQVIYATPELECVLPIDNGRVILPEIAHAAMLIID